MRKARRLEELPAETRGAAAGDMEQFLYQYSLNPTTWVYLSSLLTLSIFFKFNRVFSVRNLDLIGLIALSPGLLMVAQGQGLGEGGAPDPGVVRFGFVWLFVVGGLFLIRLLADPMMVRRPLLDPNLTTGGMLLICVSLLIFMVTNVASTALKVEDLEGPQRLDEVFSGESSEVAAAEPQIGQHGPGYLWLHLLPSIPSKLWQRMGTADQPPEMQQEVKERGWVATAKIMAIMSHLAIVIGLVVIGYRHFDNVRTGIAVATLYLLLPYTAQMTGRVDHVLPAALLVWATEEYRRPLLSGILLGLAIGAVYYPVFLLPLWGAFYWQRGLLRFVSGVAAMMALLAFTLYFTPQDAASYTEQLKLMFGWPGVTWKHVDGFWSVDKAAFRITVMAAFLVMCGGMAIWPARKNLGTLLSCSAAVMLGTQFWQAHDGGLRIAWYLPLLVLTAFRPNLEDRMAISTLTLGWRQKRRTPLKPVEQAA